MDKSPPQTPTVFGYPPTFFGQQNQMGGSGFTPQMGHLQPQMAPTNMMNATPLNMGPGGPPPNAPGGMSHAGNPLNFNAGPVNMTPSLSTPLASMLGVGPTAAPFGMGPTPAGGPGPPLSQSNMASPTKETNISSAPFLHNDATHPGDAVTVSTTGMVVDHHGAGVMIGGGAPAAIAMGVAASCGAPTSNGVVVGAPHGAAVVPTPSAAAPPPLSSTHITEQSSSVPTSASEATANLQPASAGGVPSSSAPTRMPPSNMPTDSARTPSPPAIRSRGGSRDMVSPVVLHAAPMRSSCNGQPLVNTISVGPLGLPDNRIELPPGQQLIGTMDQAGGITLFNNALQQLLQQPHAHPADLLQQQDNLMIGGAPPPGSPGLPGMVPGTAPGMFHQHPGAGGTSSASNASTPLLDVNMGANQQIVQQQSMGAVVPGAGPPQQQQTTQQPFLLNGGPPINGALQQHQQQPGGAGCSIIQMPTGNNPAMIVPGQSPGMAQQQGTPLHNAQFQQGLGTPLPNGMMNAAQFQGMAAGTPQIQNAVQKVGAPMLWQGPDGNYYVVQPQPSPFPMMQPGGGGGMAAGMQSAPGMQGGGMGF